MVQPSDSIEFDEDDGTTTLLTSISAQQSTSPSVQDIIERCWHQDPEKRPSFLCAHDEIQLKLSLDNVAPQRETPQTAPQKETTLSMETLDVTPKEKEKALSRMQTGTAIIEDQS